MAERRFPLAVCPCCGADSWREQKPRGVRCQNCGVEIADPDWLAGAARRKIDHGARQIGLASLRRSAAEQILDTVAKSNKLAGSDVLDVGCGYGWFMEATVGRGMHATGIEPDTLAAIKARDFGQVIEDHFPECLAADADFDLIVFNDVLEHIEQPDEALAAARKYLKTDGITVVACPDSVGPLYTVARFLAAIGIDFALDRLWQRGFPSPHLFYFNQHAMRALARRAGLEVFDVGVLPTMALTGLRERITMDAQMSKLRGLVISLATLMAFVPIRMFERIGRPDIRVYLLRAVAPDEGD